MKLFLAAAMLCPCAVASAQIVINEPGFAVDTLVAGQLDQTTPRIEAIRNPAFGSGVVAASVANGILTVRRFSQGQLTILATVTGVPASSSVLDLRFAPAGLFSGDLFVTVQQVTTDTTTIYRVSPGGTTTVYGPYGGGAGNDGLAFYLEFTAGIGGYPDGAILIDLSGDPNNPLGGSSIWELDPSGVASRIVQNSLPAGRADVDIRSVEIDRSGAFGSQLLLADADANQSTNGLVYQLSPSLVWTAVNANQSTNTRYYRDMAISPGGLLGAFAYLTDGRSDTIQRLAPDGSSTIFASGFMMSAQYDTDPGGAASLSINDSGTVMYVADDSGIYRIRQTTDAPGPTLLCREPNSPSDIYTEEPGLSSARVIWTEPVLFNPGDLEVIDANTSAPIPFSVSGSGSQFMLVSFGQAIIGRSVTIRVHDTAVAVATGNPIDGDANGIAGGDAEFTLHHRCKADFAAPFGVLNFFDISEYINQFNTVCP